MGLRVSPETEIHPVGKQDPTSETAGPLSPLGQGLVNFFITRFSDDKVSKGVSVWVPGVRRHTWPGLGGGGGCGWLPEPAVLAAVAKRGAQGAQALSLWPSSAGPASAPRHRSPSRSPALLPLTLLEPRTQPRGTVPTGARPSLTLRK